MKLSVNIFWVCCLFTLNVSCHQDENDHAIVEQPVLFQFEMINHAWGYMHSGWLIDNEGSVRFYNLPEQWIFPDEEGFISEEAILSNLSFADSIIHHVNLSRLYLNYQLVDIVNENFIVEGDKYAYDAGTLMLSAYRWDESQQKFRQVFLAQNGVVKKMNIDPSAQSLTSWLIRVGLDAGFMSWF